MLGSSPGAFTMANEQMSTTPMDRLTRIADGMVAAMEAHDEWGEDVKCVVFLSDPNMGGMVFSGYGENGSIDGIVDVLFHLKAAMRANGKELVIIPIGDEPAP